MISVHYLEDILGIGSTPQEALKDAVAEAHLRGFTEDDVVSDATEIRHIGSAAGTQVILYFRVTVEAAFPEEKR